jgi:hypothetical protein
LYFLGKPEKKVKKMKFGNALFLLVTLVLVVNRFVVGKSESFDILEFYLQVQNIKITKERE